tara:strand:+ start:1405 stop:1848 length:444 start_codon:yes stop_codon:yes gene_type:complete
VGIGLSTMTAEKYMRYELKEEVLRLGGDPASEEWIWFLTRGPYGDAFTWSQGKRNPAGYVGLNHLRDIVADYNKTDPGFIGKAQKIVKASLNSSVIEILRRGIQVASVVGDKDILTEVKKLTNNPNEKVSGDAKACVFELKRLLKGT